MLARFCSAIDHTWHLNVVKTKKVAQDASMSLMFFPHFDVLRDLILNINVTCAFINKQSSPESFKFSFFLISFDRISWLQTLLSGLMNFLCSLILCLITFFRFLPFSFTGNVGVETRPRLSTIAGEQLINQNVRLESEQQKSMLCIEFFLRYHSHEWVGKLFIVY